MSQKKAAIEAILFLQTKPVTVKRLAKVLDATVQEVETALSSLMEARNVADSGLHVLRTGDEVQLGTNPDLADVLAGMTKEESASDLTRPQLETLTVIAYRGPITKAEVEQIRGVNCSLILRNLLMRGLVNEEQNDNIMQPVYTLSMDMMRHLGIHAVTELPDYESLHQHAKIDQLIESLGE